MKEMKKRELGDSHILQTEAEVLEDDVFIDIMYDLA